MSERELMRRVAALRAEGHSPREIARALGVRPAAVAPLVRRIAAERAATAPEADVARCWVSPGWSDGLTVDGQPDWPDADADGATACGLVSVLVARERGRGRVSVCGYLVDVYCLGVKDALGPRVMTEPELSTLVEGFFAAYGAPPLAAPMELARHLVLGAVEYARGLGFEPHPDFRAARGHLGAPPASPAIRFGHEGKPLFVEGERDDARRIMRTLDRSVGRGNYHFIVCLGDVGDGLTAA
jgi:hypothetical protein